MNAWEPGGVRGTVGGSWGCAQVKGGWCTETLPGKGQDGEERKKERTLGRKIAQKNQEAAVCTLLMGGTAREEDQTDLVTTFSKGHHAPAMLPSIFRL